MKIVTAIDSMKGSLSSRQASEAAAEGIRRADPAAQAEACPVGDGGEGTVGAMTGAMGGHKQGLAWLFCPTSGPICPMALGHHHGG